MRLLFFFVVCLLLYCLQLPSISLTTPCRVWQTYIIFYTYLHRLFLFCSLLLHYSVVVNSLLPDGDVI